RSPKLSPRRRHGGAARQAKATAGGDPALARTLFRNALAGIPPNTFDPRPELSDEEIDALLDAA
ncbi:MAG: hypothetical protein O7E53_05075, partial [Alphaproteobacteria bacterium]|nr:hypothetical protein [Alphaproteobacteria bacterium]